MSEIKDVLRSAGFEVEDIKHTQGRCERCGNVSEELAFNTCFPCGMLEDPESTDIELYRGLFALLESGYTFEMWLAGRKRFGKLVPTMKQVARIEEMKGKMHDTVIKQFFGE